jgi:hypothetical protein
MAYATCDPGLAFVQPGLGFAADSFDLNRVTAGEICRVEDPADSLEIDGPAVANGREVPVFVLAAIVLDVNVSHEVLDLFQLIAGVEAAIVIGDVPGIEIEPHVGMIDLGHQSQHRHGILGRALVRLERQRHTVIAGGVAQASQVRYDRGPFVVIGRLARAGDACGYSKPPRRESNATFGQIHAFGRSDIGAAYVTATDSHLVRGQMIAKCLNVVVGGGLGDDGRLGNDQAAEIVGAKRQLEVINARLTNPLDRRPDAGGAIRIGEATDDSFHEVEARVFDRRRSRDLAGRGRSRLDRLEGDREFAGGIHDPKREPAGEDV